MPCERDWKYLRHGGRGWQERGRHLLQREEHWTYLHKVSPTLLPHVISVSQSVSQSSHGTNQTLQIKS